MGGFVSWAGSLVEVRRDVARLGGTLTRSPERRQQERRAGDERSSRGWQGPAAVEVGVATIPIGNLPAPRTRGPDGNGHGHELYGPYEDSVGPTSSRSGATTPASEAEEREEPAAEPA